MNKTKIEWCDMTWNPVVGCFHECEYCYARNMAKRFEGSDPWENPNSERRITETHIGNIFILDEMQARTQKNGKVVPAAFPFGFSPTFRRYNLYDPQRVKKAKNVFVCSMADLFGDWVPDEWIKAVFHACAKAPQHRYLFLTKNPKRYAKLYEDAILPVGKGYWYGSTSTGPNVPFFYSRMPDDNPNTFVSIEPLLKPFGNIETFPEWVILGAETGNRKGKVVPEKEWVDNIVRQAREKCVPVFMKESLLPVVGEENMLREFPW